MSAGTVNLGDLCVSSIGFGAMRLTGSGVWGPPANHHEAVATLRRAVELGVNFIDTAESYGPYVSEGLIAEALYPYPAGLVIATKGGLERPGPDQWVPNGRPERLRHALEGSLRRLRLPQIDLYQLHRVDPAVPADDQFGALQDMRAAGLVRHIGLSEVDVTQIDHARRFFPVVSVQNQYNVADRHWEDVLAYCTRERIAFIPWHPLGAGNLARHGAGLALRRLLGRDSSPPAVSDVARRHRATPSQVAIAWLLQRSPVVLPIPGTSTRTHLEENLAAGQLTLSPQDVEALDATVLAHTG
jgi:aryl-alcohol dehydrogenase-like predicted oxidoreductase